MSDLKRIVGERVRKIRTYKKLSQEDLAYSASLHSTYIGQIERGEKNATLETLGKIANALEVPLESLVTEMNLNNDTELHFVLNRLGEVIALQEREDQIKSLNVLVALLELIESNQKR